MHHPLTPTQQTAIDFARRDLTEARAADLASIDDARLILLVERLRGRLDDVLRVVDEVAAPPPP
ncbi:hypothetical protein [Streptomyces chartreusis]|uniref:hypothetical protein n=1 Tax=Streptomyces chartreusis TaxID=1969 RepID=UPI003632C884